MSVEIYGNDGKIDIVIFLKIKNTAGIKIYK